MHSVQKKIVECFHAGALAGFRQRLAADNIVYAWIGHGATTDDGKCRPHLILLVTTEPSVVSRLEEAVAYAQNCKTLESVTILLRGNYSRFRPEFRAARGTLVAVFRQSGRAPHIWVCLENQPDVVFFLSDGRPAGAASLWSWWQNNAGRQDDFSGKARFIEELQTKRGVTLDCSFIQGYTNQPPPLNGQALSFGSLDNAGRINDWSFRLYMPASPKPTCVGFPERIKLTNSPPTVPGIYPNDEINSHVPLNQDAFMQTPDRYIMRAW